MLSGQGLGNLDDYLRNSYEIVSGYSAAMGAEAGAVDWDWIAALAMIAVTLGSAAWTTRGLPAAARIWTVVLIAALCLVTVKQGFVRHDVGHILTLVAILAAPLLALRWRGPERFAAAAAVVAFSLLAAPLTGRAETDVYRPLAAAGDAIDQLRLGLDAGRREATAEAQRAAARGGLRARPADARPAADGDGRRRPLGGERGLGVRPRLAAAARLSEPTPPTPPGSTSSTRRRSQATTGPISSCAI